MDETTPPTTLYLYIWALTYIIVLNYIHLLPTGPPGPPHRPIVSKVFKDSCLLSWEPPAKDGGAPITGYHIERRSTASKRWVFINKGKLTGLTLPVKDLFEDTEYDFRVSAENKVGTGSPSEPTHILAKDPWGEWRVLCNLLWFWDILLDKVLSEFLYVVDVVDVGEMHILRPMVLWTKSAYFYILLV